jgi:hypothetical protein
MLNWTEWQEKLRKEFDSRDLIILQGLIESELRSRDTNIALEKIYKKYKGCDDNSSPK